MSSQGIPLKVIQPTADTIQTAEIIRSQIHIERSTANIFTIYRSANASQLCMLFLSVCCAIGAGAAMPLVTVVYGNFAREFITGDNNAPDEIRDRVQRLALYLVYIAIWSLVTTAISTFGFNIIGEKISRQLQQKYLASALRQNMAYFDVVGIGELTSHMDQDMKLIQAGISQKVGELLSGLSGFVVAIVCAFIQNGRFAGIMISQPIALLTLIGVLGGSLSVTQRRGLAQYVRADNLAQEVLSAMRSVIAYRSQERYGKRYYEALRRPAELDFRERFIFGMLVAGSFMVMHWANGLGVCISSFLSVFLRQPDESLLTTAKFWQADHLLRQGRCTISEVLTILYAMAVAGGMLSQALPSIVNITQANAAASRVFSVIERKSPIDPSACTGVMHSRVRGEISFEGVHFTYPSRPEGEVLKDVNFVVPAGHTVAFVGPSGSGKSTVFALLERLYHPHSGRIMLDGEPIDAMNVSWLRSQIGYVGQDVTLFRASILDNIAYGLPEAAAEDMDANAIRKLVIEAAKVAQIHDFIASLPEEYNTIVGAHGSNLSGGQKQRLAIARAIISQPAILLLDEATAALDSRCEKAVQEALDNAASGRTTLIIAHRLSTIQNADKIIVMKDGQILGQGSHSELLSTSAMYRELVRYQALETPHRSEDDRLISQIPHSLGAHDEYSKDTLVNFDTVDIPDDGPLAVRSSSSSVRRVWSLNRPELPYTVAGVSFSVLAGITYPVQAIFFGNGIISMINPDLSTDGHNVQFWASMYLTLGIIAFVVYSARGYCFAVSASRLVLRARSQLFKHLIVNDLPFFQDKDNSIGALVSFLASGPRQITGISGTSLGLVAESIVMLATGITIGCIFGWKLGLAATATVPLVVFSSFMQYHTVAQVQKHITRDTGAVAIAHEALSAIKTVTVLGLQKTISASFESESHRDSQSNYWLMFAATYACTTSLRVMSIAFVFWYGGTHLIATGEYNVQQFFICFAATMWGSQSASVLFAHAPDIVGSEAAAARLEKLMQAGISSAAHRKLNNGNANVPSITANVSLRRVNFRYPSHPSRIALNDVSLDVPAGAFIALVGATGSGKSSVINLLERFYTSESGAIALDDMSIEQYDLDSYRGYLALVDQNPCLIGEDLRDCLQSGEVVVSDTEILAALKDVGLADFVLSLPQGLSTSIMANGSTLSGGQRQRMAIAKALLCRPKILLLDEATSALDSASEELVQRTIQRVMKGRTVIAIAHRLKTIVDADEILVFKHGQIVERGSHGKLMQLEGEYWQMARLQSLMGEE
ncbi:ABC transporter ATP-binding protein [Aspergillus luchuensis]|uniref:GTPase-activating protein n=3 Tax=Aspergillus subgen. Circumdati TaxID=2720871 RepID=A0A7R7WVP7_ASPKA|nr:GTPase-activating protein [Aspergillus luchuensis]BCR97208.1 GTPase-activating protein [Aspergillus luchuensis]BCS09675.1 GTPase-activating protein [Aspergillus luchuensis]GAA88498.1 ATP-binding cassette transporter [Aspergillus luchuensis IFO 4308]